MNSKTTNTDSKGQASQPSSRITRSRTNASRQKTSTTAGKAARGKRKAEDDGDELTGTAPKRAKTTMETRTRAAAAQTTQMASAARATRTIAAAAKSRATAGGKVDKGKRKARDEDDEEEAEAAPPTKKPRTQGQAGGSGSSRLRRRKKGTGLKAKEVLSQAPWEFLDVYVFGANRRAELGFEHTDIREPRWNPRLSGPEPGIVQVATGSRHCVALTRDNHILTWGYNFGGALGRDIPRDPMVDQGDDDELEPWECIPREIPQSNFSRPDLARDIVFTQVAAGNMFSFAVTDDGYVYGWGTFRISDDKIGFLEAEAEKNHKGPGTGRRLEPQPVRIPGLDRVIKIACGRNHAVALRQNGDVVTWGCAEFGSLGRRVSPRQPLFRCLRPTALIKGRKIRDVFCGAHHSFAVQPDGSVWSWGMNSHGQTGIPPTQPGAVSEVVLVPARVSALSGLGPFHQLVGSEYTSLAVQDATGECYVWGRADQRNLGLDVTELEPDALTRDADGMNAILTTPTPLLQGAGGLNHVAMGLRHGIAVAKDGKAFSWGASEFYQTGQNDDWPIRGEPLVISSQAIGRESFVWAGAGDEYGMLATKYDSSRERPADISWMLISDTEETGRPGGHKSAGNDSWAKASSPRSREETGPAALPVSPHRPTFEKVARVLRYPPPPPLPPGQAPITHIGPSAEPEKRPLGTMSFTLQNLIDQGLLAPHDDPLPPMTWYNEPQLPPGARRVLGPPIDFDAMPRWTRNAPRSRQPGPKMRRAFDSSGSGMESARQPLGEIAPSEASTVITPLEQRRPRPESNGSPTSPAARSVSPQSGAENEPPGHRIPQWQSQVELRGAPDEQSDVNSLEAETEIAPPEQRRPLPHGPSGSQAYPVAPSVSPDSGAENEPPRHWILLGERGAAPEFEDAPDAALLPYRQPPQEQRGSQIYLFALSVSPDSGAESVQPLGERRAAAEFEIREDTPEVELPSHRQPQREQRGSQTYPIAFSVSPDSGAENGHWMPLPLGERRAAAEIRGDTPETEPEMLLPLHRQPQQERRGSQVSPVMVSSSSDVGKGTVLPSIEKNGTETNGSKTDIEPEQEPCGTENSPFELSSSETRGEDILPPVEVDVKVDPETDIVPAQEPRGTENSPIELSSPETSSDNARRGPRTPQPGEPRRLRDDYRTRDLAVEGAPPVPSILQCSPEDALPPHRYQQPGPTPQGATQGSPISLASSSPTVIQHATFTVHFAWAAAAVVEVSAHLTGAELAAQLYVAVGWAKPQHGWWWRPHGGRFPDAILTDENEWAELIAEGRKMGAVFGLEPNEWRNSP